METVWMSKTTPAHLYTALTERVEVTLPRTVTPLSPAPASEFEPSFIRSRRFDRGALI